MTKDEFVSRNKNADVIVNFFNEYYAGKEVLVNAEEKKKGIILGLNKHLEFTGDQASTRYSDIKYLNAELIPKIENIAYTVAIKVQDLLSPKFIPFESFMKSKNISAPNNTRRSYKIA